MTLFIISALRKFFHSFWTCGEYLFWVLVCVSTSSFWFGLYKLPVYLDSVTYNMYQSIIRLLESRQLHSGHLFVIIIVIWHFKVCNLKTTGKASKLTKTNIGGKAPLCVVWGQQLFSCANAKKYMYNISKTKCILMLILYMLFI